MTKNRELDDATAKRVGRNQARLAASDAMREAREGAIPKDVLAGLGDPTPELAAKHQVVKTETIVAGRKQRRNVSQRLLDLYVRKGYISQQQYDAGHRLFDTWQAAGGLLRITQSFEIRVDGNSSDALVTHLQACERIEHARRYVGNQLSPVLFATCIEDVSAGEWARKQELNLDSGIVLLRFALDRLAEWYGKAGQKRRRLTQPRAV